MPGPGDLDDLDDPGKARTFILNSQTAVTAEMNRSRVTSQLYLAHKTKIAGDTLAAAVTALATAIEQGLAAHAQALQASAAASEKHARGLNRATWALVGVTGLLVVVTVVTLLK